MTLALPERTPSVEPIFYKVSDAERVLSMSKSVIYGLIRTGRLRTVKEGRARLIPASAIHEYVALLEREAGQKKWASAAVGETVASTGTTSANAGSPRPVSVSTRAASGS
ncbi:helix-turn-helix domain-containing protein [Streptomyces sp. UG1]|uniref:helix-turn-helix domain-containing protein n=1 Tax=Streptomyces sp. UG1 TaxID=3417652 RepID=UPI003CE9E70A